MEQIERRPSFDEMITGSDFATLSSTSRGALDGLIHTDKIAEHAHGDIFALSPTQLCTFLATHNVLAAPKKLKGSAGRTQTADSLWILLKRHHGNSRDPPRFRVYKCIYHACPQWSFVP
jgi:hypothetical protein